MQVVQHFVKFKVGVVEAAVEDAAVEDAEQLHLVGVGVEVVEVGGAVEEDVVVEVVATNQFILSITSISGLLIFVKFHLCHQFDYDRHGFEVFAIDDKLNISHQVLQ